MANMGNHTFIDGIGDISMRDGVIRMDLLALSPTQRDKEGAPTPQFVDQLVMSPPAFGRLVQALGGTVKQMQEKGMIPKRGNGAEPDSEAKPTKASAAKKFTGSKKASPNF